MNDQIAIDMLPPETISRPVRRHELASEPFRILFHAAVFSGLLGAVLWPLHLWLDIGPYPGPQHAHLMACGFFGGFILGFLGTAAPRLLGSPFLAFWQVMAIAVVHIAMSLCFTFGFMGVGISLFLVNLLTSSIWMGLRFVRRTSLPPPGFVLLPVAVSCGFLGAMLSLMNLHREADPFWAQIQKLFLYQGFVLLPILGIGPFLFPRFFGAASLHDFEESGHLIPRGWIREFAISVAVGFGVLVSFWLEITGSIHAGPALRGLVVAGHFARTLPWCQLPSVGRPLARMLRWGWVGIIAGLGVRALYPSIHVALMHWVFVGGFAMVTLATATRVVCGHCGAKHLIEGRGRWITTLMVLILLGTWTRISGDLWPKIQKTHFGYGALLWIAALATWAWFVLPRTLKTEDD